MIARFVNKHHTTELSMKLRVGALTYMRVMVGYITPRIGWVIISSIVAGKTS
jgi:hypothetical protein